MTVSIGAITLHEGVVWENEFDSPLIAMSTRRTLGGTLNTQTGAIIKGREILLTTKDNQGNKAYFTRTQVQALKQVEQDGSPVAFVHPNETIGAVMIVPGSISVRPLGAKLSPTDDDIYTGSIKLLEV